MTVTPAAGTYYAAFNCAVTGSANNWSIFASIYSGGTQVASSERQAFGVQSANTIAIATHAVVTVNGSQAVEIRWRASAGVTASVDARALILLKLS